jgi:hypothetical protein
MTLNMRIRCTHYFDEDLTDLQRVGDVMNDIANGKIRRPEFEVVLKKKGQKERVLQVAALFEEGKEFEGWFVSHPSEDDPRKLVAYRVIDRTASAGCKELLLSGCPETIDISGILSQFEACELIKALVNEEVTAKFERVPYFSIVQLGG